MRYVGGKGRISREISEVILGQTRDRDRYLEPFVGGGAMFARMAPHFKVAYAGDTNEDLILMWNALLFEGWEPPTVVTEAEYAELRDARPSPNRGFVGTGGSFGGKWFAGYARGGNNADGTPRNHQAESARSLLRIRTALQGTGVQRFRDISFLDWGNVDPGTVVYCDPPYEGVQGYATGEFPHEKFWAWVRANSVRGVNVFVSEYSAPDDFEVVWERAKTMSLTRPDQGRPKAVERLYRWKGAQ